MMESDRRGAEAETNPSDDTELRQRQRKREMEALFLSVMAMAEAHLQAQAELVRSLRAGWFALAQSRYSGAGVGLFGAPPLPAQSKLSDTPVRVLVGPAAPPGGSRAVLQLVRDSPWETGNSPRAPPGAPPGGLLEGLPEGLPGGPSGGISVGLSSEGASSGEEKAGVVTQQRGGLASGHESDSVSGEGVSDEGKALQSAAKGAREDLVEGPSAPGETTERGTGSCSASSSSKSSSSTSNDSSSNSCSERGSSGGGGGKKSPFGTPLADAQVAFRRAVGTSVEMAALQLRMRESLAKFLALRGEPAGDGHLAPPEAAKDAALAAAAGAAAAAAGSADDPGAESRAAGSARCREDGTSSEPESGGGLDGMSSLIQGLADKYGAS